MFKKATKSQAKLRAAVFGPSGAGKTFSSLRIATGLGGPIALIDTERGSASKYADRFEFDVCDLENKSIDGYVTAIKAAAGAGYKVLIIDSLSHAWQELLEQVDQLAKAKYRGNTWSAWSDGTPKQRRLVDAILGFPGHVLATMRSKTEWTTGESKNGKSQPVRVGLAPEQGKGIEYEFDLLLEVSPEHTASVIKDRTGRYQDTILDKPGEDFGRELAAWLSDAPPPEKPKPGPASTADTKRFEDRVREYCRAVNARWADKALPPDELINSFRLVNHMLKEAEIVFPDGGKHNERMRAAAGLWLADEAATLEGWKTYVARLYDEAIREATDTGDGDGDPAELVPAGIDIDAEEMAQAGRDPGSDDE